MKKESTKQAKQPLTTRKKGFWIGISVVLVFVLIVLFLLLRVNGKSVDSALEFLSVTRGSIVEKVDTYGILEARPSINLNWKSDGIVGEFDIKVGDKVEADQSLMELEPSSQSTEILNAYTNLLDAQYQLDLLTETDADYQEVLGDLVYQEKMLINKKADKLAWNYGQSSEERVNAVRDNYYAIRAEVWKLEEEYNAVKGLDEDDPKRVQALEALEKGKVKRDSLKRALNQILGIPFDIAVETDFVEYDQQAAKVAEARVAYNNYVDMSEEISAAQATVQSLQNLINEAKIITPTSGTVTSVSAVAGQVVNEGTEAVRIDNLDNLVVPVNVSQADINKIEIGQVAVLTFDGVYKKEYTGFVQTIDENGTTDSNGVVQFIIEIKVENADEDVKPGFTAVVNIIVNQVEDALVVSNQAITTGEDGTPILTVAQSDGSMRRVPVELGAESDAYTQVISDDIHEGDQVAVFSTGGNSPFDFMSRGNR